MTPNVDVGDGNGEGVSASGIVRTRVNVVLEVANRLGVSTPTAQHQLQILAVVEGLVEIPSLLVPTIEVGRKGDELAYRLIDHGQLLTEPGGDGNEDRLVVCKLGSVKQLLQMDGRYLDDNGSTSVQDALLVAGTTVRTGPVHLFHLGEGEERGVE